MYVLSCARPRAELTSRTIRSGAGKTSLSVRNRSRARRKRTFGASCSRARSTSQASSSSKSRDRSIEKPRGSRTSVKCCEARLLASSVGLNLVRADLELVRDKAGGRSRSCAQIARNEAEVAKGTKLKREPQAVCCPPRRRATRSRSAPVSVDALIRSSPGISSGKLAHLANSVSEKIEAGTDVSSDWSRGFPSLSLRYRL